MLAVWNMNLDGDTLSAIFGWISMGCWVVVYSPQFYENYKLQSGEGLSILLLFCWIAGDLCSFFGAIIGGLAPSVIWLGLYFLLSDCSLLGQVYYYRWKRSRWPIGPLYDLPTPNTSTTALASETGHEDGDDIDEELPLLASSRAKGSGDSSNVREDDTLMWMLLRSILCMILISLCGIGAWWVNQYYLGGGGNMGEGGGDKGSFVKVLIQTIPGGIIGLRNGTWGNLEWLREPVVQVLGWTSAALYIGSNLPQILKNFETRCEGLSSDLFVFMAFGSLTFVISICSKSLDKDYIIMNAGWLAGHCLAGLSDFVIIGQIIFYRFTEARRRTMYTTIR